MPTWDAVVVLGAKPAGPGEASAAMRRRVAHAVGVMQARGIPCLIVSGGVTGDPPSEAVIMHDLAIRLGVAAEFIIVEDRSRNTFENAVFTAREMRGRGWRRLLLVTDAWHMPRARYVFRRLGIAADGAAVPRPADLSRRAWLLHYLADLWALARSAWLFRLGRHKPIVAAILHR